MPIHYVEDLRKSLLSKWLRCGYSSFSACYAHPTRILTFHGYDLQAPGHLSKNLRNIQQVCEG